MDENLRAVQKNQLGRLIGAIFGLVFVLRNAGELPSGAGIPLRVLAILAFLRLFLLIRRSAPAETGQAAATFGRGYRLVVAAEVVAGAAGLFVLGQVLDTPKAAVGWIALVVGVHFFGLAAVWRMPSVHWLAAGLSACGAGGLALAFADAPTPAIATVAGITPGLLLLAAVAWTTRTPAAQAQAR
ncbi:hypothetical protein ABT095_18245 [Kitasatospora sp. NPDC002227]|uniref:hypothetical protein n=1 Tax=Kitasatospora sp. NPDC002227 TaxID=3154773 RepID=UPI0033241542